MKKIYKIIGICIILLVMFGCGSRQVDQLTMKELRVGKEGINVAFIPDSKDIKVYQEDQFLLNLMIHNQGAAASNSVYVLVGVEDDYVKVNKRSIGEEVISEVNTEITSQIDKVEFAGKTPDNPAGDYVEYEAELEAKKITLSKLQETLVSGILCYSYGTKFEDSVCVQPQNNLAGLQPACQPEDIKVGSKGQGAPLAVTKVEVRSNLMSGGKIRTLLKIFIENLGKGDVINDGTGNYVCSAGASEEKPSKVWNYLQFVARMGGKELKCRASKIEDTPFYLINLKDKKAEVICESINPVGMSYKTPLLVEMFYDYTQTITKKLVIEKI